MPQLPTAAPLRSLLEHRLVIVTGKGGTGKTSVAAALALAGAASGRHVLAVEVGRDEHLCRLIAPGSPPVGYAGRELLPGLTAMRIDPYAALGEYLGIQLRVRSAVELVLRNRAFRQLMDASPGWRELITLGKVWHLEQMRDARDVLRFDLLVVDAPATGHGIGFLDVPRVVVSAVRTGPLRRNAVLVEEMIADRDRTLLLPVALAEELPARETADLVAKVRGELHIALDRIVVNALVARPFPPGLEDLDAELARLPAEPGWPGLPPPRVVAACAAHLRARHDLNRVYLEEIARSTRLPVVPLPFLATGVRGTDDLARLVPLLLATPLAEAG